MISLFIFLEDSIVYTFVGVDLEACVDNICYYEENRSAPRDNEHLAIKFALTDLTTRRNCGIEGSGYNKAEPTIEKLAKITF
jgi:hypothetical protein